MLSRIRTWIDAHTITVYYGAALTFYLATITWGWIHPTWFVALMAATIVAPLLRKVVDLKSRIRSLEAERSRTERAITDMTERMENDLARHRAS